MGQALAEPNLNNMDKTLQGRPSLARQIIIFSALFIVIAAGVYLAFIQADKTLIRYCLDNKDGLSQRYMFLFEFKRFITNIFAGGSVNTWDWSLGLGSDAYNFNAANIFNPLSYIPILFPAKLVDVAYSLTIILRIYLSGLAFLLFGYKVGFSNFQAIAGSISYAFCPWIIVTSVSQGHFVLATILLPLLLLGIEKVLKGESPVFFMIMVAYSLILSMQWAYILGIIAVPYYLVRYFTDYNEGGVAGFFRKLGIFIVYGLIGMLTSAAGFLLTIVRFGGSTIETTIDIPTLFEMDDYIRMPSKLTAWGAVFSQYSYIGISAICLIMIPVIVYLLFKKKTPSIMTVLLLIAACIPEVSSMFNFFSYMTGRWFFVLVFFFIWAAVEGLKAEYLKKLPIRLSILGTYILYGLYMVWFLDEMEDTSIKVAFINCFAAGIMVVIIFIMYSNFTLSREKLYKTGMIGIIAVLTISLVGAYHYKMASYPEGELNVGEAEELMAKSPQRVGSQIDDADFYRIDQVDGVSDSRELKSQVNEAMYYGNRSVYEFASSIDYGWLEYNKYLGNNAGYYKRTSPNSNDNRSGLDLLLGVRYFIGDDVNGRPGASDYAAYGFDKDRTIDGVDVLKSKYSIGLGTVYDTYMKQSEWLKLNELEREQALLQTAVVKDSYKSKNASEIRAADVETDIQKVPFTTNNTDEGRVDMDKKIMTADVNFASFNIHTGKMPKGQVMVTFKNLKDDKEGVGCWLFVSDGKVRKTIANTIDSHQGLTGMKDYTVCMGYSDGSPKDYNVSMQFFGSNYFDDIEVNVMSTELYDKYASELQDNSLKCTKVESDLVEGTVDSEKGGIMYLSILDDNGWDVYVDGEKAKKINRTNIAFTGVEVSAGSHDIRLEYHTPWLGTAIILTLIGLVLISMIEILHRRRKTRAL